MSRARVAEGRALLPRRRLRQFVGEARQHDQGGGRFASLLHETTEAETGGPDAMSRSHDPGSFSLKPDWNGPYARSEVVDVNLGHTPESFVRAAYYQITGEAPPVEEAALHAARLRQEPNVRRIDIVRAIMAANKRQCRLTYADPWRSQPELLGAPERRVKRQVGAVFMFFFNCPGGVNCGMDWANTHAPGMDQPHSLFGFEGAARGYYTPSAPGFWRRELLDAKYAGLQFFLLNAYGPDIADGKLEPLSKALASLDNPVHIALFDDTWTWGRPYFGDIWKQQPDLRDAERAAATLYESKWKPFYCQLDRRHWFRFKGRPFIYFYNAGRLGPRECSAAVIEKMKARFRADFGEDPFVDIDSAYFDDSDMARVADAKFKWFTFDLPERRSRSTLHGHLIDHAMVKWDAVARDRPGATATPQDLVLKGPQILERVLAESLDAELLVLATWNDLGEGTGINRNYDYYVDGRWLEPDYFMRLIRQSQSGAGNSST